MDASLQNDKIATPEFLSGGGEMGQLIREKDWTKTPLGDPKDWPQSLRTMVSVMLDNPFGMYIAWGSEYTQLYNDGYRPILGSTKHPKALGISTRETFSEIWHIIESMFDGVMKGKAVGFPDFMLPLNRYGYEEECYFDFSYSPIRQENGAVGGVLVTVIETTDKKKAQAELLENTNQLKFAIEAAELGTWDYNPSTNKFTANDRLKKWFGLSASEEIELHHATDAIAEKDRDRIIRAIKKVLDYSSGGVYEEEYSIINPVTNKEIIVQGKGRAWFNDEKIAYRFNGILQEVTENVLARKKIEESEEQLRIAIEGGELGTFDFTPKADQLIWSAKTKEFFGLPPDAHVDYKTYLAALHPEDRGTSKAIAQQQAFLKEDGLYELEYRTIGITDGKLRWLRSKGKATYNKEGEAIRYTGVIQDITKQKESADKVRESEQRLRLANEASGVAVWEWNVVTGQIKWDNEMFKIYGLTPTVDNLVDYTTWSRAVVPEELTQQENILQNTVKNKGQSSRSFRIKRASDGELRHIEAIEIVRTNTAGHAEWVVGTNLDVTEKMLERKKTEDSKEAIRQGKEHLEFVLESAKGGDWDLDLLTGKAITSFRHDQCFGATVPFVDWNYEKFLTYVHPEDRENEDKKFKEAVASCSDWSIDCRVVWNDDTVHWIQSSGRNYKFIDGKPTRMLGMVRDVTEQKEAQKQIEESNKRFRTTVKQAPVGISILRGPRYIVEMANDAYLQLVDRTEDKFVGQPLFDSLPEVEDAVHSLLDSVLNTGVPYHGNEVEIPVNRHGKLEIGYFDFLYYPLKEEDGKISGVIVTVTEVSEKVEARKKTEQNEERLNIIVEASELGTWELTLKTREVKYSRRYLEILGGYKEDPVFTHEQLLQHLHPDDAHIREQAFNDAMVKGYLYYESRLIWKDKSIHWMEGKGKVFYDKENNPEKIIGTIRDITEEKNHESELKESEYKFRLLADSMPQQIWTSDTEGNLNYYNQSVFDYSGLTLEQINKDGWLQIVHPDDRDENIKEWVNSVTTGKDFLFEHRFRRYDGAYRWQLSRAIPQRDSSGNIQMWVGTSTDIHDKKNIEVQLDKLVKERTVQLERSNEDLQQFAHVASHDLKEPVRKIMTFCSRLIDEFDEDIPIRGKEYIEKIQRASKRMTAMIEGVLTYSSLNAMEQTIEPVDLNRTINNIISDLEVIIQKKGAIIRMDNLPSIEGADVLIYQLFYNLVNNSLKFSKPTEAPVITIRSSFTNDNGREMVSITVTDNGIGFQNESSEKIFNTFARLNSKDKYEGTGLGLALCKKIVERHNGFIRAKGEKDSGATFTILLPLKQHTQNI